MSEGRSGWQQFLDSAISRLEVHAALLLIDDHAWGIVDVARVLKRDSGVLERLLRRERGKVREARKLREIRA